MNICNYLSPENIVILKPESSKNDILRTLALELAKQHDIKNANHLAESIVSREAEGSTFLPTGIAIPHARVPDVEEITAILGVMPEGFKETPDADPTYMVFLFFSPVKDKEFGRHLKLLARIASIFRDPAFVKSTAELGNVDRIFSVIQHKERETEE